MGYRRSLCHSGGGFGFNWQPGMIANRLKLDGWAATRPYLATSARRSKGTTVVQVYSHPDPGIATSQKGGTDSRFAGGESSDLTLSPTFEHFGEPTGRIVNVET